MLDIGWPELLVVMAVGIVVIGPNELPRIVRSITSIMRKMRMLASEFRQGLEEMADASDMRTLDQDLTKDFNPNSIAKDVKNFGKQAFNQSEFAHDNTGYDDFGSDLATIKKDFEDMLNKDDIVNKQPAPQTAPNIEASNQASKSKNKAPKAQKTVTTNKKLALNKTKPL